MGQISNGLCEMGFQKQNMNYSLKHKIWTVHSIILVIILHNSGIMSLFYIPATQANLAPIIDNKKKNTEAAHELLKIMMTGVLDFGSTSTSLVCIRLWAKN